MKGKDICKSHKLCSGCEACANACPKNAISMKPDWRGFMYPIVDKSLCIDCKLCQKVCPSNITGSPKFEFDNAFVFIENNKEYLERASSGGAFGVIARYVISQGGIVYGAAMDDDYNVIVKSAETIDELKPMHGSKYVQTIVGMAYRDVKDSLKKGRLVLYCGCPCHIAALKSFLQKDYENLITMDLICHGVPSQPYFRAYVKDLLKRNKNRGVTSFKFRYKTKPFASIQPKSSGEADAEVYVGYYNKDYYMSYFLWGKGYRDSCYNCRFAGDKRQGDFTIGDYGRNNQNRLPIDVTHGSSLVLGNSAKVHKLRTVFENNGIMMGLKSMEEAVGPSGSHLKHPSKTDLRSLLIYILYRILGLRGPKLLFKLDMLRIK